MSAAPQGQAGAATEPPVDARPWSRQWGLEFVGPSGAANRDLERRFWATRATWQQTTAAVLSAGVALVHGLLAFKLYSQGQTGLAHAAAATTVQQLLVWLLAVLAPYAFSRLRPLIYGLSATFPSTSPLVFVSSTLPGASCSSPGSPAFWVSQLLASGVPWLVAHAVLFPLTVTQGILVHGVATLLLLGSNRHRCTLALQQCPAAGPWVVKAAGLLQRLSIFSGTGRSQLVGSSAGVAAGGPGGPATELLSCMGVFAVLQVTFGYAALLQLAWWMERASRLAFLRRTDAAVEAEWALERKQPPPLLFAALELLALMALCWQAVSLWMSTEAAL